MEYIFLFSFFLFYVIVLLLGDPLLVSISPLWTLSLEVSSPIGKGGFVAFLIPYMAAGPW